MLEDHDIDPTFFRKVEINIDLDGRITEWDEGAQTIYGYSREELCGNDFCTILPYGGKHEIQEILEKIKAGVRLEQRKSVRIAKTGELVLCMMKVIPVKDETDKINGIISSECRYTLHSSVEEKFSLLYPAYNHGMAILEVIFDDYENPYDFRLLECNKGFEFLTKHKLNPQTGELTNEITPDGFQQLIGKVNEVVLSGKSKSFNSYIPLVDKYYHIIIGLIHDNQLHVQLFDITENIQREKELNQKYTELNNFYEELTASQEELRQNYEELGGMKAVAEQANNAKGQFLANMSHEIRTPINGIFGMISLLEGSTLNEEQYEFINAMKYSASHLIDIVNDILDISRIESDQYKLAHDVFNLKDHVEKIIRIFKININSKNIKLTKEYSRTIPREFVGDSLRINQILYNLLENAVKFTEEGEVKVNINERLCSEGKMKLLFSISDTGVGIPEGRENELFEMFTQGDSSYTKKYGGTGLGLAICKKLVERMNGEIWYESQLGNGTTFYFTIELGLVKQEEKIKMIDLDQNVTQLKQSKVEASNLRKKMILIADDNEINQMVVNKYLTKKGYESICVFDGRAILDKISTENIGLILMDIQMPELNGIEATRMIREQEEKVENGPHMPIIAMTSYAMGGDREKFLNAGMDDYISKPIDFKLLDEIVEKYLR